MNVVSFGDVSWAVTKLTFHAPRTPQLTSKSDRRGPPGIRTRRILNKKPKRTIPHIGIWVVKMMVLKGFRSIFDSLAWLYCVQAQPWGGLKAYRGRMAIETHGQRVFGPNTFKNDGFYVDFPIYPKSLP
jgi:hypothetical protein